MNIRPSHTPIQLSLNQPKPSRKTRKNSRKNIFLIFLGKPWEEQFSEGSPPPGAEQSNSLSSSASLSLPASLHIPPLPPASPRVVPDSKALLWGSPLWQTEPPANWPVSRKEWMNKKRGDWLLPRQGGVKSCLLPDGRRHWAPRQTSGWHTGYRDYTVTKMLVSGTTLVLRAFLSPLSQSIWLAAAVDSNSKAGSDFTCLRY